MFNTEIGKKFLALIKASLKVSDLIPDLVLRGRIKTQILDVYKIFIEKNYRGLLKEIDILDGYLFLAGHLNLIKEEHCRALRNGFLIFKSRIVLLTNESPKTAPSEKKEIVKKPETTLNDGPVYTDRQGKIMEYFQEHKQVKLAEILGLFPDVSEKTVRNELKILIGLKKITRSGNGNSSFYEMLR
ncbi:DeoR family transcriptional regulator [Patescibacteria group bacterium]|nr:DeoR family transcriptional regulator [Patescibacteria group bacterium]